MSVIKEDFIFGRNPIGYLKYSSIFESDIRYWFTIFLNIDQKKELNNHRME